MPVDAATSYAAILYSDAGYSTQKRVMQYICNVARAHADGVCPKNKVYALRNGSATRRTADRRPESLQVSGLFDKRITQFTNKAVPLLGFPRRNRDTDQNLADI